MLSLVALPVEIQLEIFTRCTYESLKQLQRTCTQVKNLIVESAALDSQLFRVKEVDVALLRKCQASLDADRATIAAVEAKSKGDSFEEVRLLSERLDVPWGGWGSSVRPVRLHRLLEQTVTITTNEFEEHWVSTYKPESYGLDHLIYLHKLAVIKENATDPPVSHLIMHDPRSPLKTKNLGIAKRGASVEIHNSSNEPVTVEQFLRNYYFYAKHANKKYNAVGWHKDKTWLAGWGSSELRTDGTLVLDETRYE
ncbi:hypothetical protein FA09DRAFT_330912 [Tilletiopsis washingtonensis]|uniref:F-box domain-containing protein n=1 Tax=Tilletiopsis washingtonensis TaxID=58919 RepID=A0A316Z783_9BASI|nr:hypothetical protein FA09DRAFT_330912 [Tilletiopsis washingtonensis]PWN96828.1 hypothetical protein FA09DRAFT_330912 [Tilletiopsis washingtonensis]